MPNIAFLNGRFMPLSRAKVSVEDRGYQFGDGVYEVLRARRGRILFWREHHHRLEENARAIGISLVYPPAKWEQILNTAFRKSGFSEARIYVQLTRGVAPRAHGFPTRIRSTVLATVRRHQPLARTVRTRGVAVITVDDQRWGRCDLKTINLLPNVLAKQQARMKKVFEAVFIHAGRVMEGATSNLFAVVDQILVTPSLAPNLLPGITRDQILQLAREASWVVQEREILRDELYKAQEVFLTGTTIDLLPVVKVDGRKIGDGRPGSRVQQLDRLYQDLIHGPSRRARE